MSNTWPRPDYSSLVMIEDPKLIRDTWRTNCEEQGFVDEKDYP